MSGETHYGEGGDVFERVKTMMAWTPQGRALGLELTKLEGLSVAEAAARTGASESAIKVQVHRGLKRLAALVRRDPSGDVRQQPRPHAPDMNRPVHERSK